MGAPLGQKQDAANQGAAAANAIALLQNLLPANAASVLGRELATLQEKPPTGITPARKFRMLLHINPTRQRGKRTGSLARASGWYMTFFAAGVISSRLV